MKNIENNAIIVSLGIICCHGRRKKNTVIVLQEITDCYGESDFSVLEKLVAPSLTEMILPSRAAEMKRRLETTFPNVKIFIQDSV